MSLTSELLPEPLTPVTQTNVSSGNATSTLRRLWCRAPTILSDFLPRGRRCCGTAIDSSPERYLPGEALGLLAQIFERPLGHDLAAAHARARAEIDDVVGFAHRLFVVFDDDDRVSLVAQVLEAVEQQRVVARVQADRRFVENVDHADQTAADLGRQPNPLALAARQGRCAAVERQVIESAPQQEARAGRGSP